MIDLLFFYVHFFLFIYIFVARKWGLGTLFDQCNFFFFFFAYLLLLLSFLIELRENFDVIYL
jgi:hypothetical protein